MNQVLLWDITDPEPAPMPPHNGTETSREAAESVRHIVRADEARVLDVIRRAGTGGMTCDEIEVVTGLKHQTASARCAGMSKAGWIVQALGENGNAIRRPTRSNRPAAVWVVAESEPTS